MERRTTHSDLHFLRKERQWKRRGGYVCFCVYVNESGGSKINLYKYVR